MPHLALATCPGTPTDCPAPQYRALTVTPGPTSLSGGGTLSGTFAGGALSGTDISAALTTGTNATSSLTEANRATLTQFVPQDFGAKCDWNGTSGTDDSGAFNNLISFLGNTNKGGTITVGQGQSCFIGTALSVNAVGRGVVLQGAGSIGQDTSNIPLSRPMLVVAHGNAVVAGNGGTIRNLMIISQDAANSGAYEPANMQSLATHLATWVSNEDVGITINGGNATLDNVEIIGFSKCLTAINVAPTWLRHVRGDCINGGETSGAGAPSFWDDLYIGNLWAANLSGHNSVASVGSPGGTITGYTNGQVVAMTNGTGSSVCSANPTVSLAVGGGNVTGATVVNIGDCTTVPGNFATYPNAAFAGGVTFPLAWTQAGYRPGKGLYVHDRCDGCTFRTINLGGFQTGVEFAGGSGSLYQASLLNATIEAGNISDGTSKGLYVTGCMSKVSITGVYAAAHGNSADLSNNANPTDCAGRFGYLTVTDLRLADFATDLNNTMLYLGTKSGGVIQGLQIDGPAHGTGATFTVADNVSQWTLNGVLPGIAGDGTTSPWYSIDASSLSNTCVNSMPPIPFNCQPAFRSFLSTPASISAATVTTIPFDTVTGNGFDPYAYFDTSSHKWTPLIAGHYKVTLTGYLQYSTSLAGHVIGVLLQKNGSTQIGSSVTYSPLATTFAQTLVDSQIVYMNGSTDYLIGQAYMDTQTGQEVVGEAAGYSSWIEASYVGP